MNVTQETMLRDMLLVPEESGSVTTKLKTKTTLPQDHSAQKQNVKRQYLKAKQRSEDEASSLVILLKNESHRLGPMYWKTFASSECYICRIC